MHNVEKSKFQKGMYVGYGGGAVWHIRSYGKGNWKATPQGNNSHKVFTCATLRDVSTQLETLNAPKAKGETFAELVRQNPAPRKYRGKYPRNIKEIYSARVRGAHGVVVILNDGSRHEITAGDTKGVPPALNENFDAFMAQVSAPGFEPPSVRAARGDPKFDLPKTNPAKRSAKRAPSARVGKTRKQYVSRPSQAPGHKTPSKRLQARRKKALNAPQGYFPNPVAFTTPGPSRKTHWDLPHLFPQPGGAYMVSFWNDKTKKWIPATLAYSMNEAKKWLDFQGYKKAVLLK